MIWRRWVTESSSSATQTSSDHLDRRHSNTRKRPPQSGFVQVGISSSIDSWINIVSMKRPEEVADEFQKAWNSHEMAALASLFCEDATFVNRFGHYVRGVQEIVSLHAPIHETIYSDSTMENEVISTIALGDDTAVVHCWSRLTVGKAHPAGPHAVD